ncbi:MAG TPA: sulfide/dihydroorotate dehydrogenase-like FAD/NAD-binding protein [Candidatus Latescibacteria bacterium]|nr:sulfide/dihydroorotate dehydrogenase-like FAD/NAD-binding protein [Candidatus Latescibacterota bacterium]
MHTIMDKRLLAPNVYRLEVGAQLIAERRKPGQFIILRVNEESERIPLTIVESDPVAGTIVLVFQVMGEGTRLLASLEMGDEIRDVVGPLGHPTEISHYGTVVCVAGGIGVAPMFPIAKGMADMANTVISIVGARTRDLLILQEEIQSVSSEVLITTDDGTFGRHGFVTDALKERLESGFTPDAVVAIGPLPMMRAVAETTRPYCIKTIVSLNPIMVDGTGMCGGCRVSVGGQMKFACVDGPEFDGHQVNYAELANRQRMYRDKEACKIRSLIP